MKPPRAAPSPGSDPIACPVCTGSLERIPRHLGDRLLSVFSPRWRYRCVSHVCGWEGCLRPRSDRDAGPARTAVSAAGHDTEAKRPPASAR